MYIEVWSLKLIKTKIPEFNSEQINIREMHTN